MPAAYPTVSRVAAVLLCLHVAVWARAAPGDAKPAPAPTPAGDDLRGDRKRSDALLETATNKLRQEYANSLRDPRALLREHASYFLDHPAQLNQAALVAALERPVGSDPRQTAYVRWQLLSAAPKDGQWEKDLLPKVIEICRRAPLPAPRFGVSTADQRKLEGLLAAAKADEAMRLTDLVDDAVVKGVEANRVVLAYRDALYATLPIGYERFSNGLRDAFERLGTGWAPKELMKRVEAEAIVWANSGVGDPKQYAAAAQLVYRLRSERGPRYYVGVGASRSTKQPYWMTRTEALYEAKKLADLQKLLEEKGNVRRPTIDAAVKR